MMYGSCEDNPGYDSEYLDAPEEPEEEPMTTNEFLQPTIDMLRAVLAHEVDFRRGCEIALQMLEKIPVQAACCPVCGDQYDAKDGAVPPPTVVRKRGCGHYCCDRCVRHCADQGCSLDGCENCMGLCEGHADPMCHEHTIAKCYCKECAPPALVKERDRELAFIED